MSRHSKREESLFLFDLRTEKIRPLARKYEDWCFFLILFSRFGQKKNAIKSAG